MHLPNCPRLALPTLLVLAAQTASAGVLTLTSITPTSTTGGTRDWSVSSAANGIAGTSIDAFSEKSFAVAAPIGSVAVTDWVILDSSADRVYTRMAAGNGSIGAISLVNNTTDYAGYTENANATGPDTAGDRFTWTGGTEVPVGTAVAGLNLRRGYSGSSSNTGAEGNGISFTIASSTSTQHLRIYAGSYEAWGRITATLGDGSAAPLSVGWGIDNNNFGTNWVAEIAFASDTPTTLTITMLMDGGNASIVDGDKGNFDGIWVGAISTTAIPEPGMIGALAAVLGLGFVAWRRRN